MTKKKGKMTQTEEAEIREKRWGILDDSGFQLRYKRDSSVSERGNERTEKKEGYGEKNTSTSQPPK